MTSVRALVILATLTLAAPPARADYADDAALGLKMARRTVDRVRRGIAIGPHVGYGGGFDLDGNGTQGIAFGLALYTFKVPTVFDAQEVLAARIRARVIERVKAIVASGGAAPSDLKEVAKQVAEDVREELLGPVKRRAFEKPSIKVVVEGVALVDPGGFQIRSGFGKGLGPVCVSAMGAFQRSHTNNVWFVGAELGVHATPIGLLRTPVLDLFVRGEYGWDRVNHGESDTLHPVQFTLGLRALVDVL